MAIVMLLSTYSSLLAAKFAGFSACHRLRSYGKTGHLSKFTAVNVNLTAKQTPCGFEPFWTANGANLTIDFDGVTLHSIVPCLPHSSLVAVDEVLHKWTGEVWVTVEPTFHVKKAQTSAVFKYTVDKSEPLFSENLDYHPSKLVSMLGELSGLMQQEESFSIGSFIETTKEKAATYQTLSIFQKLKYAGIFRCCFLSRYSTYSRFT